MTIGQAMETAQRERPGEATEADMLRWLSQLDAQWFQDVVMRHEHEAGASFAGYTAETARDTALLIPVRWEEIYIHYLFAMTDQKLGEVERYQNDAALFNQGLTEAQAEEACRTLGYEPKAIRKLKPSKHIFSHVEWHMHAFEMEAEERPDASAAENGFFAAEKSALQEEYSIPTAFKAYMDF